MGSSSFIMENTFNVLIIIPSTGNRIELNHIQAFVEPKVETLKHYKISGMVDHEMVSKSWLEIEITMFAYNYDVQEAFNKIKQELFNEEFLLNFIDIHPNLIKCRLEDISFSDDHLSLKMQGNTTDKTYDDFISETTIQLNKAIGFESNPAKAKSKFKSKLKEEIIEEIKILKRKITF